MHDGSKPADRAHPLEETPDNDATAASQAAAPAQAAPMPQPAVDAARQAEEGRLLRRLQLMMNLVVQTIQQDGSLGLDEASQMVADARAAALAMFPGKELAFDLIWRPRLQRALRERFRAIV